MQCDAQARLELRKHDERIIVYLDDEVRAHPLLCSRWSKRSVLPCIKRVMLSEGMHRTRGVRVRKVGKRYVGVKVERWNPSHRRCPSKVRMCLSRVHVLRDWEDDNVLVLCTSHMTVSLGWRRRRVGRAPSISTRTRRSHALRGWPMMKRTIVREVPSPPSPFPAPLRLRA